MVHRPGPGLRRDNATLRNNRLLGWWLSGRRCNTLHRRRRNWRYRRLHHRRRRCRGRRLMNRRRRNYHCGQRGRFFLNWRRRRRNRLLDRRRSHHRRLFDRSRRRRRRRFGRNNSRSFLNRRRSQRLDRWLRRNCRWRHRCDWRARRRRSRAQLLLFYFLELAEHVTRLVHSGEINFGFDLSRGVPLESGCRRGFSRKMLPDLLGEIVFYCA